MQFSEKEKQELKALIDRGEALPAKYRQMLFAEPHEAELIWPGKTHEVTNVVLPFQSIEQIDEPRSETAAAQSDLFQMDQITGRQSGGWTNKLIWGDNKLVLSSLKNGPLRREIEEAGGIKLVYIDPPFDVGADFSFDIEVGELDTVTKEPSVIEDIAYRDTWGRGADSFISMIHERLILIRELLAGDGSIYVHCDPRVNSFIRIMLNEIFSSNFFRNEIIWQRTSAHSDASIGFGDVTDTILFYTRSENARWNQIRSPLQKEHVDAKYTYKEPDGRVYATRDLRSPNPRPNLTYDYKGYKPHANGWSISRDLMEQYDREGRLYFPANPDGRIRLKIYLEESKGMPLQNLWTDIPPINSQAQERLGYPTQKPLPLLERIVSASSQDGDIVADFFLWFGHYASRRRKAWSQMDWLRSRTLFHTHCAQTPDRCPAGIERRWQTL